MGGHALKVMNFDNGEIEIKLILNRSEAEMGLLKKSIIKNFNFQIVSEISLPMHKSLYLPGIVAPSASAEATLRRRSACRRSFSGGTPRALKLLCGGTRGRFRGAKI